MNTEKTGGAAFPIHSPYTVTDMQVAARDSYRQAAAMIEERKKYVNQ